jgi:uncharacterized protein (UPF0332 family)
MEAAALLNVARNLLERAELPTLEHEERAALVRTAINRIYYTCLWSCKKALLDIGFKQLDEGPGIHGFLVDVFKTCQNHNGLSQTGLILEDLKKLRTRADYKPNDKHIENINTARPELENAQYVLEMLGDVRHDPDKFATLQNRASELDKIRRGK